MTGAAPFSVRDGGFWPPHGLRDRKCRTYSPKVMAGLARARRSHLQAGDNVTVPSAVTESSLAPHQNVPVPMNAAPRLVTDISDHPVTSLTILVPVMNEEGNLPELYARVSESLAEIGLPYEIIIVDDGSPDGTGGPLALLVHEPVGGADRVHVHHRQRKRASADLAPVAHRGHAAQRQRHVA